MRRKIKILSGLLLLLLIDLQAQDTVRLRQPAQYSFIKNDINVISNIEFLASFYQKLADLKNGSTPVANILHLGDSHIQADYFTHATRKLLQEEFGNAGLGLTFPGRVAHTNESSQIFSSTTGHWIGNRLTYSQHLIPLGISGIAAKTELAGNTIKIKTINKDYSFNRITLFFQKDFNSYNITVKDSANVSLAVAGSFTEEAFTNSSKLLLPYATNQVILETNQSLANQKQFILYGVSLENSKPGIRYHIIGVNGAKYKHYAYATELLNQTQTINPDLIIISLGTNEASEHPYLDPKFELYLSDLTAALKKRNPETCLLLTTTPDFYKKRTRRNPGVQLIRNKIIDYAKAQHIAYWDLYEVAGGTHAADAWKKYKLLQTDGIHYTKKGYGLQGQLLFDAIIKGYHDYVLH